MFRIRFASGEEAFFRSVNELAEGVRTGTITATAEIFHARSQQWLPIAVHPAYEQAVAANSALEQPADLPPATVQVAGTGIAADAIDGGEFQIFHMTSKSGLEIAERRRPRSFVVAVSLVCGLVVVGAVVWLGLPGGAASENAQPFGARELGTVPSPRPLSTSASRAWANSPASLALRLAQFGDNSAGALHRSARELGRNDLTSAAHLGSPTAVQATRVGLFRFREGLDAHRAALQASEAAYADTATMLYRTGAWGHSDMEDWRTRTRPIEPPADAARADSLLTALEQLYDLLVAEAGRYRIVDHGVRFTSLARGDEYLAIRGLIRHLTTPRDETEPSPSTTLAAVLSLAGESARPAPFSR